MAPNPSSDMIEQGDEVTSFFSLARELRDRIYDLAREDRCKKVNDVFFDFRAAIPKNASSAVNKFVKIFEKFDLCTFERFPRLATKSCYLELAWTSEVDYETFLYCGFAQLEIFLRNRLRSLQGLVAHLSEIKEVHIELLQYGTHNLKDIKDELIACPVLTSFSMKGVVFIRSRDSLSGGPRSRTFNFVPWSWAKENVDFAIWSRGKGFLVDNTDEEKATQEVKAARERFLEREAAEIETREAEGRVSDALDSSGGTGENSRVGSVGEEDI